MTIEDQLFSWLCARRHKTLPNYSDANKATVFFDFLDLWFPHLIQG
jgi:hypothetical protein